MLLNGLQNREIGYRSNVVKSLFSYEKFKALKISDRSFDKTFSAAVNCVDIDNIESRYLLAGFSNGGIAIFDTHIPRSKRVIQPVAVIDSSTSGGHKVSVDCIQWYPHDTGLFMTLAADQILKVWDANEMQVADEFKFSSDVYSFDYSARSKKHSLIAVGSKDTSIYLCDLKSGSKSHILKGNKGPVYCVKWSPRNSNVLISGSNNGSLIAWDVRKTKSMLQTFSCETSTIDKMKVAHKGSINGVTFTADGLHLISFATDQNVRLWDLLSAEQIKVEYGRIENTCRRTMQLSCTADISGKKLLFVPSTVSVKVLDIFTGASYNDLNGHFRTVNGCFINNSNKEMYSFSNDTNIVVWDYLNKVVIDESIYEDNWSDDGMAYWKDGD